MRLMQEGKTDTRLPGKHSFNAPRTVSVSVYINLCIYPSTSPHVRWLADVAER